MSPKLFTGAARAAGSTLLRAQSDARLVSLCSTGHAPAFEAIVARYRAELVRYCARLVGPGRAEDAVQQAFLNAHLAMPSIDPDTLRLRAWLYRIAHNASVTLLRAGRRGAALDEHLAAPGNLEADFDTRQRLHGALAAIAALPEPQRDALMLQAIEGRSHEEIAAALDLTPAAARQTVHRARTTLRTAVTAVTPYPLLARLAGAGPWGGSGNGLPELAAAGGGLVTAGKVGTAVIAAGAIAGGAMTLPAREPVHANTKPSPAKRAEARAATTPTARASIVPATVEPTVAAPASADDRGRGRGSGNDDEPGHLAAASRDEDEHGEDREDRSGHRDDESRDEPDEDDREDDRSSGPGDGLEVEVEDVEHLDEIEAEHEDRSGSGDGEVEDELEDELDREDEDHSGPG